MPATSSSLVLSYIKVLSKYSLSLRLYSLLLFLVLFWILLRIFCYILVSKNYHKFEWFHGVHNCVTMSVVLIIESIFLQNDCEGHSDVTPRIRPVAPMASRRKESGDSVVLPSGDSRCAGSLFPLRPWTDQSTLRPGKFYQSQLQPASSCGTPPPHISAFILFNR